MRLIIQKTAPYTHRSGEIYRQALSIKKHYILASLVKGEVLSHQIIRATTGGITLHPPTSLSPQPSQNHINRFAPHHALASLVKGRWLDGKAQTVASLRLLAIYPPFLFAKLFCRQDGGIALHPPSLSIPTTFSKAHQPFRPTPCPCLPCQREVD